MELEFDYHKKMEVELRNVMILWLIVLLSLCYCYAIGKKISKGIKRLLFVLPVIVLFVYLPLNLYSFHLSFFTSFFICFLGNLKLLLFAFGEGPLSSDPSMSLADFLAVASLPIQLRKNPPLNGQNKNHPSPENPKNGSTILTYAIQGLLLAMVIYINTNYWEYIHPKMLMSFVSLHSALLIQTTLAVISALAGALLGVELEPNFNEPYLSTSPQNFWGRRWNLMATNILHLSVYQPAKKMFTRVLGCRWATPSAVVATFLVSGLFHELMFYHSMRMKPTGELTLCFFLLQGICVAVEIELKKTFKKWHFPWSISVLLTFGLLIVTTYWLYFSPMKRYKAYDRVLDEYGAISAFFNNVILCFGFVRNHLCYCL
ncbi:hypothetical protein Dsin_010910 [Dipteronia sinensis]|uniref:Wax synthase domain-containing protein n=1 Tax=Dipteronia sinensis TaxID=43782 RepID=A0AAE0EEV1_9ROSI|nr:hypothetical protein Dsin_010910 [Dipteronia sinensis]